MDNKVLDDIKKYAIQRLKKEYGFCGVIERTETAMLYAGDAMHAIRIKIDISEVKV